MAITIRVTDPDLALVGDPLLGVTSLDVTDVFNGVGTGEIVLPAAPEVIDLLDPGCRVEVVRDGALFLAGPMMAYQVQRDTSGQHIDPGTLRINFASDMAYVAGRLTYPNPALAASDGAQPAYWTATSTPGETILLDLVDANAGPGALTARRVPHLTVAADGAHGATITYRTRWEPLADALRAVALQAGGLGFRVVRSGATLEFQVYVPDDLTAEVRYSWGLGNIPSMVYRRVSPTVTTAIVGGEGEGADRIMRERADSADEANWWRVERFVDQGGVDVTAELDQAGDQALTEGGEGAALVMEVVDTAYQRYGTHYRLGDVVSVSPIAGVDVAQVVRGVHLTYSPDGGEVVSALIGTSDVSFEPAWVARMREVGVKLARLGAK